jgi:3',5'-cyclic AMP phosphodiesterase CpdA
MTRPGVIAHISDLHLSPEHRRINIRRTKRILEHLPTLGVDHLVITGDISANAEKKDFQLARTLLRSYGWLDGKSLSVVIGNHDVYGGVHHAEDVFTFPKHCKHTDMERKVNEFHDHFHEAFDSCGFGSASSPFPFVKQVHGVVLIGMNSVAPYSKLKNPIGSNGEVSVDELRETKKIFDSVDRSAKRKFVLIHHHFYKQTSAASGTMHSLWNAIEVQTMKLRGKKELQNLFASGGADLVLHGHMHENREYVRKRVRCVNGGGSVLQDADLDARLNLVTLRDDRQIEVREVLLAEGVSRGRNVRSVGSVVTHAAA